MSITAASKGTSLFLQPYWSTFIFNQVFWKLAEGSGKEIGSRNSFCFFNESTSRGYSPGSLPSSPLGISCVKTQWQ